MNENAKKWVEALRSGEFNQCKGYLNRDNRYCCLGVACEISMREMPLRKTPNPLVHGGICYDADCDIELPKCVQKWLGLTTTNGRYNGGSLIDDNDGVKTFEEIADIIERHPELFVQ